ncbi:MAG: VOC family protein [Candidatus Eremiobacteraeota bacterium]|nr:VOC family protein [Candidatus Eremiobacteraeota bacterium]
MSPHVPPHGTIAHLAINADDLDRSQTFYEQLFGWRFEPWGPPGFFQIETPGPTQLLAALQQRRELVPGTRTVGFECTVAVDDVRAALRSAVRLGGRVIMEPVTIPTVCDLAFIEDPAGNVLGVARYESAAQEMDGERERSR